MKDKSLQTNMPQLQVFEKHLKQHLAQWFSAGFLHLERVTWQSPAAILEKVTHRSQNSVKVTIFAQLVCLYFDDLSHWLILFSYEIVKMTPE